MKANRIVAIAIALTVSMSASACGGSEDDAAEGKPSGGNGSARPSVTLGLNPNIYAYTIFQYAEDRGLFDKHGVDVSVRKFAGSSDTVMPQLARGDFDLLPVIPGGALFNGAKQGFKIRLLAPIASERPGWVSSLVVVAGKKLYDSGELRSIADLRGRTVDATIKGAPADLVLREALRQAGLSESDVSITYRLRDLPTIPGALDRGAVDASATAQPIGALAESNGSGKVIASGEDSAPWFTVQYLGASEKLLRENRDGAVRFVAAYLEAADALAKTDGRWTPPFLSSAQKLTGLPADVLKNIGGPAYVSPDGEISLETLARSQQFQVSQQVVKAPVDVATLVDASVVKDARTLIAR